MFALLPSLGFQEMAVLLVIGLLLYGRNLPEAGRALGRVAAQLRRGFHEFKQQIDREGDLSEVKRTLHGTAEELKKATKVPTAGYRPQQLLEDWSSPAPESPSASPASPWHQEPQGVPFDPEEPPIEPPDLSDRGDSDSDLGDSEQGADEQTEEQADEADRQNKTDAQH